MNEDKDRYQFQPWYIKLWRRRHYLRIPIMAIRIMIRDKKEARFAFYWGFAKGIVQAEYMNWIWTWDEAEEICAKKSARRRKK